MSTTSSRNRYCRSLRAKCSNASRSRSRSAAWNWGSTRRVASPSALRRARTSNVLTTQTGCLLSLTTPFGADVLLLEGFGGNEAISAPFRFDLRMRSTNTALDPQTLIGKSATVALSGPSSASPRFFNGIVTRFAQVGASAQYGYYSAELAPRLWLLSLGRDRAIYQNLSALDIVKQVLAAFSV